MVVAVRNQSKLDLHNFIINISITTVLLKQAIEQHDRFSFVLFYATYIQSNSLFHHSQTATKTSVTQFGVKWRRLIMSLVVVVVLEKWWS